MAAMNVLTNGVEPVVTGHGHIDPMRRVGQKLEVDHEMTGQVVRQGRFHILPLLLGKGIQLVAPIIRIGLEPPGK